MWLRSKNKFHSVINTDLVYSISRPVDEDWIWFHHCDDCDDPFWAFDSKEGRDQVFEQLCGLLKVVEL